MKNTIYGDQTYQVNHARENWCSSRSATIERSIPIQEHRNVIAIRADIRDASPDAIVHASIRTKACIALIIRIRRVVISEVGGDCLFLVVRSVVDVAEATG